MLNCLFYSQMINDLSRALTINSYIKYNNNLKLLITIRDL